ncbi:MAG: hypothetical protein MZW92_60245 [Comamonadaceae bacterium]|nr:hypothetical protein [Comamonadaceae bacterium]
MLEPPVRQRQPDAHRVGAPALEVVDGLADVLQRQQPGDDSADEGDAVLADRRSAALSATSVRGPDFISERFFASSATLSDSLIIGSASLASRATVGSSK